MTTPQEQPDGLTKGLIERLEAAEVGSRELDAEVCVSLQYGGLNSEGAGNVRVDMEWGDDDLLFEVGEEKCCNPVPPVTTSLDDALSLAERLCPGMVWSSHPAGKGRQTCGFHVPRGWGNGEQWGTAATPALALCAAILKAHEARS